MDAKCFPRNVQPVWKRGRRLCRFEGVSRAGHRGWLCRCRRPLLWILALPRESAASPSCCCRDWRSLFPLKTKTAGKVSGSRWVLALVRDFSLPSGPPSGPAGQTPRSENRPPKSSFKGWLSSGSSCFVVRRCFWIGFQNREKFPSFPLMFQFNLYLIVPCTNETCSLSLVPRLLPTGQNAWALGWALRRPPPPGPLQGRSSLLSFLPRVTL